MSNSIRCSSGPKNTVFSIRRQTSWSHILSSAELVTLDDCRSVEMYRFKKCDGNGTHIVLRNCSAWHRLIKVSVGAWWIPGLFRCHRFAQFPQDSRTRKFSSALTGTLYYCIV